MDNAIHQMCVFGRKLIATVCTWTPRQGELIALKGI